MRCASVKRAKIEDGRTKQYDYEIQIRITGHCGRLGGHDRVQ